MRFIFVLMSAVLLSGNAHVRADWMLDQFHEPTGTNTTAFVQNADWSQTFTVGFDGTLDRVEMQMRTRADTVEPLLLDIRSTLGGVPTEADAGAGVRGQVALNPGQLSANNLEWVAVDLSGLGIQVSQGDQLALVLRTDATNFLAYSWNATNGLGSEYPNGAAFLRSSGGAWRSSSGVTDLGFRTFVTLAAVPEPSSFSALLCVVAVGMLRMRNRRDVCVAC